VTPTALNLWYWTTLTRVTPTNVHKVEEAATRETTVKETTKVLELTTPVTTVESLDILPGTVAHRIPTRSRNRLTYLPINPKKRTQTNRTLSLIMLDKELDKLAVKQAKNMP
jgi:hypothetical protein